MVRLEKMVLHNFKSFAGKITIPFPEGFNIVAGPNGSGKSNIIDALLFVLGVTSARSIRAKKLKNLVFNGSPTRKAAEMCEISLYLDNSDGKIPVGDKKVKLERRVSRSGISSYRLNGKTVTKAKIMEMLSRAGLSSDGYNIIMQGDVTRIIEMSSNDRRGIIDDISGIAEFDEKKAKSARELEIVEFRVRENMIVVAEKQRLVTRLKLEKENAEKYQKFEKELIKSKASLNKKNLSDINEKIEVLQKEIDEETKKFDELDKEFSTAEKELESKEEESEKRVKEIINKSKNYDVTRKIDQLQTEIIRKKDKIDLNERELVRLESFSSDDPAVKAILDAGIPGVRGTIGSLVKIPAKYSIALEVAMGRHMNDVVVDYEETAAECIKYLKQNKIGRIRFLPLETIRGRDDREYRGQEPIVGKAIELIEFESQYETSIRFTLGSTLVVDNIDIAKNIKGFRIVTLDGDMVEASRAMLGGFYKSRRKNFSDDSSKLKVEIEKLDIEIIEMEKELEELKDQEEDETEEVQKLQEETEEDKGEMDELKGKRKKMYEERLILQGEISRKKIEKARFEANVDNIKIESEEYKNVKEIYTKFSEEELQEKVRTALIEINKLGPINMKAIEEFNNINVEFEEMKKRLDTLLEEKKSIENVVAEVEKKRFDKFTETLNEINKNFSQIYKDLTNGYGNLRLEEEGIIESGLIIEASPEGKKIVNLDSMSGGEKTLASLSFLFSITEHYASPFYVLDEVDAALDKSNTKKIVNLIKKYSKNKQFIVISHNDFTIQEANKVFGISMEDGVSKIFGIELPRE